MLLKTGLKNWLQRCNLKADEQVEEAMHKMIKRYTKAVLWNIDERFQHKVLIILDAFSILKIWIKFQQI